MRMSCQCGWAASEGWAAVRRPKFAFVPAEEACRVGFVLFFGLSTSCELCCAATHPTHTATHPTHIHKYTHTATHHTTLVLERRR